MEVFMTSFAAVLISAKFLVKTFNLNFYIHAREPRSINHHVDYSFYPCRR
uniref:Uncharacterized protein n=1 Tax=Lepeophtheirus salmonis TaxID=72036 RepID=A0A0K2UYA8_LEPSM